MNSARPWLVLIAVSTIYFFASATTFQSMGIVLFAMVAEFHWSEAAAQAAFLSLGVVCAATSLLPVVLIPRFGARWTIVVGCVILAFGFLAAYTSRSLPMFYFATALFGLAFSLVANSCGVYLIASWFGDRAPRMIGFYLVTGTLGGIAGPLVANTLIASRGGWRLHWFTMAAVSVAIAAICAVLIRDPEAPDASASGEADAWDLRAFVFLPQFAILAIAMVVSQACMITVSAVATPHLARLGWSTGFAAEILSLQALVGTIATGISGWLGERADPKPLLLIGTLAQGLGMLLLPLAHFIWIDYVFVVVFGIGWAVTNVAVTVLLIRYFGNKSGSAALSTIWMLSGVATAGPWLAGWIADTAGSFSPALNGFGILSLLSGLAVLLMSAPKQPKSHHGPLQAGHPVAARLRGE